MNERELELKRRVIANLLAVITRQINSIQDPDAKAYFKSLDADAEKHLNDIRMQLIREGKIRLSA